MIRINHIKSIKKFLRLIITPGTKLIRNSLEHMQIMDMKYIMNPTVSSDINSGRST